MEMNEITLETERLLLRWLREDDFEQFARMCRDPEVMHFLGGTLETDIDVWRQMTSIMGHWYFRGYGIWGVEEKSSGRLIGRIGLLNPIGWPGFELGWTLARESWGKGYATEGAQQALAYAFNEVGRDHVISCIAPANIASIKVAERLGERVEGQTELLGKQVLLYGIGREQWAEAQKRSRK
jgi:RimJ/RimL family protein N-acetyltransferase